LLTDDVNTLHFPERNQVLHSEQKQECQLSKHFTVLHLYMWAISHFTIQLPSANCPYLLHFL